METTLEILVFKFKLFLKDESIYSNVVKPDKYIPDFFRVVVANRLANTGPEWFKWLTHINTGNYKKIMKYFLFIDKVENINFRYL